MWTREQLKTNAKTLLARYYWVGFAVCLVCGIFSGGVSSAAVPNFQQNITYNSHGATYSGGYSFSFPWVLSPAFWAIFWGIFLIIALVSAAYGIFVGNLLEVGKDRFFMESRWHPAKFTTLFAGFRGNYWNVLLTQLLRGLFIFLWSLLLVVPGIIKSYEYRMVPYLLAENPNMDHRRAFALSRAMMDGEKLNLFILDLSFLGWILLGVLACGIGVWFVDPYIEATQAEFYACMRTKALSSGLSDPRELPDFAYAAM